ncbi:anti-sigma factor family protein [Bryobacter aggregatus]|uniref:anti-sigma factor family protein n=1 Tax=Bryobacter aggregatus TaxID=360054 RepID=UPI0004E202FC|nr:zf-HC2 domain-containing protein [Bryobacter aggregatus]
MNCNLKTHEQEELLLGYCSGTLDLEKARVFQAHIARCPDCRTMVEMQQFVDESLDLWHPPEVSPDFDRQLFALIHAGDAKPLPWWDRILSVQVGWKPALPLALGLIALAVLILRTPEPFPSLHQSEGLKADEIEQVERTLDDMEALHALRHADRSSARKEAL